MAWLPLLEGALATEARRAAVAIADDLDALVARGGAVGPADQAMVALLFDVLGREQRAAAVLSEAVALSSDLPLTLHGGFLQVAWVVEHCAGVDLDAPADDDPNRATDAALGRALEPGSWPGPYDLVSGLVGAGVYALERGDRPGALAIIERVVHHLDALAVAVPGGGLAFHTDPHTLPPWQRARAPVGYFNLGVAHGVPGIVGLLARAGDQRMLAATLRWLDRMSLDGADGAFPTWIVASRDEPPTSAAGLEPARTAWCYGDPGVAVQLWAAGRTDAALRLARAVTTRDVHRTQCVDGALCHGAAGVAHALARIASASLAPDLVDGAREWYRRVLAFRGSAGIGGYLGYRPAQPGDTPWHPDPSFLAGATGIALALWAAVTEGEPGWDRLLLLDLDRSAGDQQ